MLVTKPKNLWRGSDITLSSKKNGLEISVFNRYTVCLILDALFSPSSATIDLKGTSLGFSFIGCEPQGLEAFISNIPSIIKVPWLHGSLVWKLLTSDTPCPGLLCVWGSLHPLALPLTPFPCTRRAPDFPGACTGVPLLPHHTLRWVSVFTLRFSHPSALEWQEVARKGGTHYRKKDTPLPISAVSAILPKVTCLTLKWCQIVYRSCKNLTLFRQQFCFYCNHFFTTQVI